MSNVLFKVLWICYLLILVSALGDLISEECVGEHSNNNKSCVVLKLGECEFGTCSQTCVNSTTVQCSCISGFEVSSTDNSSCQLVDNNATLIFAQRSGVRGQPLGQGTKLFTSIVESFGVPSDVSYNARGNYIYWTDAAINEEAVWRSRFDGSEMEVVLDKGLITPGAISYDWIADNIYISEKELSSILVCSGNFKFCSVLIGEQVGPAHDLALLPNLGLMFWTSSGTTPGIFRAGMDGNHPIPIILENLKTPKGITADQGNNRIYWADSNLKRIESARTDGSDRRVVVHTPDYLHPYGVDIIGDVLYWADEYMHIVKRCNKFNGANNRTLVFQRSGPTNSIKGLSIAYIGNQPIIRRNDCEDAGCSHICTLGPKSNFRCICPVGMDLSMDDGKTCLDSGGPKLLIGYNKTIKTMRLNSVGRDVFDEYVLEGVDELGSMAYNPMNDSVILSDIGINSKKIVELDLKTRKFAVLVNKDLGSVRGMDIDIVGQNVYWVDSDTGTVEVMSLRTGARAVVYKEVDRPLDILIIPEKQVLVVAERLGSGGGKIVKMSMDGSNRELAILVQHPNDFRPNRISFNRETGRIYWADSATEMIGSITLEGKMADFSIFHKNVNTSGLASYGDNVYWTDQNAQYIRSASPTYKYGGVITERHFRFHKTIRTGQGDGDQHRRIYFGNYGLGRKSKSVSDESGEMWSNSMSKELSTSLAEFYERVPVSALVNVIHKNVLEFDDIVNLLNQHECSPNSGKEPCSHICLLSGDNLTVTCICPEKTVLGKSGRTCASNRNIKSTGSHLDQVVKSDKFGDTDSPVVSSNVHSSAVVVAVILLVITLGIIVAVYGMRRYRQNQDHKMAVFSQSSVSIQGLL